MSQHDEYDRNILRALQKIGKHLESIDKKLSIPILRALQKIEKHSESMDKELSISPEKVDYDDKEKCVEEEQKYMDFGQALEKVKNGEKIFRHRWNGKGMFVVYQKGYPAGIPCNQQTAKAWGLNEGDLFKCEPYLQIKMTNGSHAMWVPSINDILAEDWEYIH